MRETFEVRNKLGLHARAAAKLVKVSEGFKVDVALEKDGIKVDGRSLLEILTLACQAGSQVMVTIEGEDAEGAMGAVRELFEEKFFEEP